MRENIGLFRGKRIDNGEWVEGNLFENDNTQFPLFLIGYVVMSRNEYTGGLELNGFGLNEVDPDTIGECTGLKDKNCKLIFEGDIVKNRYNKGVIIYGEWNCGCCYDVYGWTIDILGDMHYVEIIGNIHDNPELLKGSEG